MSYECLHPGKLQLVIGLLLWPVVCAAQPRPVASAPASQPALRAPTDKPLVLRISLRIAGRDSRASYWLRRPAGHGAGQKPPLLIVLHGTDDTAPWMLDFWSSLAARLPVIIAAPEGIGPGWRDEDVPAIKAMLEHLRANVPFDPDRVLLAGFSAGGAMACHMLYAEAFPATAVAVLANYVPPYLAPEQIQARRDVPVFYAVGMEDVNHERMRDGIDRLRNAGGDVELYRPRIGHKLDAKVAQAALDWLFEQSAKQTAASIEAASNDQHLAAAALRLERIVAQAVWHDPTVVAAAQRALERLESRGRAELEQARALNSSGQPLKSIDALLAIEAAYGASGLGREARELRSRIESDPEVRRQWLRRQEQHRNEEAFARYVAAQRLVAERKLEEAAELCRQIQGDYPDTPAAMRAGKLLEVLNKAKQP